jgi:hypothetical protein
MACHVATSKLEDDPGVGGSSGVANGDVRSNGGGNDLEKGRSGDGSKSSDLGYKLVATTLSKYCAYLLFYKPKLLPVTSNSVRFMCKILVDEAKAIVANGGGDKEANGKQERSGSHQEAGIVSKGQALASDLLGREPVQGDELWKALAELWCELIIMTAPHGNIGAHQKELGKGGEFITHLWALLYHAGIDDKFSGASAAAAADAAPNGEDSNGQGGGGMCTAGPGGMTTVQ